MKGLDSMPHSSRVEGSSSSQQPIVCNAIIAHNSRRAQVDKRHKDINDEIVMLQKQLLLVDKRYKLDKAMRKMKKAKQERKKDSESNSSESDSDEHTKTRKNKKKCARSSKRSDSSSSPAPSTSAGKSHDTSSRRPPSSSDSSSSSEDRKKRRRPSDKSLSRKRSPKQSSPSHRSRRSQSSRRSKRSPATHHARRSSPSHQSKRSPADHLSTTWSPAPRARRSPHGRDSPYSHSRTPDSHRSYWSTGKSYYNQDKIVELSSYRPDPGIVFVDRSKAHRAPSVTVTEIHDEHDTYQDEQHGDEPTKDRDELEEGEVDDDDCEPEADNTHYIHAPVIVIPDSPEPDKDRDRTESKHRRTPEPHSGHRRSSERGRSPEHRRHKDKPIKQERITDGDIRDMLKPKRELDFEIIKEERYKKKVKLPSRNPKFYLPVKKIIREMRFELRKIDVAELKERVIDILWVIIRLRIKNAVQGKSHYMNFKHIIELYREHFDNSEDGELVASVLNAMQDGAFKDFVPSDDEEQPKTEDFSEFLPYVSSKQKNDENKENERRNDDVIILEKNVDVVDITDAEEDENQRLLIENAKKDVTEATDLNKQISTESVSIKIEPTLCQVKKEKNLIGDIPKSNNENTNLTQMGVLVADNDQSNPITHNDVVELNRDIKVENAKETKSIKKEKDLICVKTEKESENISTKVNEYSMTDENSGPSKGNLKQEVAETIDNFARLVTKVDIV